MKRKQADFILFGFSVFFLGSAAVSFLLMPLESESTVGSIPSDILAVGLMFWISVAAETVIQCVLAHRRKEWCKIYRIKPSKISQKTGIITFFGNVGATAAEAAAAVSLIGFLTVGAATHWCGYSCYIFVSLFVFSFGMHCILNGKVFWYIVHQDKLLVSVEKERSGLCE